MKNVCPLITLTFLTALATASADLIIEQKLEGASQSGVSTTLRVKGSKLRVDMESPGGPVSSIMDMDTGDSITLLHGQKTALRMNSAQTREMVESMRKKAGPSADAQPAKPEATGRKEKVGEFNAEVFTWKSAIGLQTLWVTKDFPNYDRVKEQFDRLSKSSAMNAQKGVTPDTTTLPGVVVKTEMDASGQKFTSTVLSAKEEELDATIFDPPQDYKEMVRPDPPAPPPATPSRPAAK